MTETHLAKRAKRDGEDSQVDCENYIAKVTENITVYKGKKELLDVLKKDWSVAGSLLSATYTQDINDPKNRVMPMYDGMNVQRDKSGAVAKIVFQDGSKIKGIALQRLAGVYAFSQEGYDTIVWENDEPDCKAALLLKSCNYELEKKNTTSDKNQQIDVLKLYTRGSVFTIYTSAKHFATVAGADAIHLCHLNSIMTHMNALSKAEPGTKFKKPTLNSCIATLSDDSQSRIQKALAQCLLGAFMVDSSLDDRIDAFLQYGPSLTLAGSLNIPKPQGQKLVDNESKVLPKQKLCTLDDDEEVLLSDLPFPANTFANIKESTLEVLVKPNSVYGKKVNGALKPMEVATIRAGRLKEVVRAIAQLRNTEVTGPNSKGDDDDSDGDSDDELAAVF